MLANSTKFLVQAGLILAANREDLDDMNEDWNGIAQAV
jgi:hypothetical protein